MDTSQANFWRDNVAASHRLGAKVRPLRNERGLTQEQVALETGLHLSFVSDIERGKRNISIETLLKLAQALHVTPALLLDGVELDDPAAHLDCGSPG